MERGEGKGRGLLSAFSSTKLLTILSKYCIKTGDLYLALVYNWWKAGLGCVGKYISLLFSSPRTELRCPPPSWRSSSQSGSFQQNGI